MQRYGRIPASTQTVRHSELYRSRRARFTLAHELGHYFIDEHRGALKQGKLGLHLSGQELTSANLKLEQEANLFASALLLPEVEFNKAWRRRGKGLADIVGIAELFDVSITCAAIRTVSLEVFSSAIALWTRRRLQMEVAFLEMVFRRLSHDAY